MKLETIKAKLRSDELGERRILCNWVLDDPGPLIADAAL